MARQPSSGLLRGETGSSWTERRMGGVLLCFLGAVTGVRLRLELPLAAAWAAAEEARRGRAWAAAAVVAEVEEACLRVGETRCGGELGAGGDGNLSWTWLPLQVRKGRAPESAAGCLTRRGIPLGREVWSLGRSRRPWEKLCYPRRGRAVDRLKMRR